jgi:hypothetical protein
MLVLETLRCPVAARAALKTATMVGELAQQIREPGHLDLKILSETSNLEQTILEYHAPGSFCLDVWQSVLLRPLLQRSGREYPGVQ